jgi:hypothetical protein
MLPGAPPRQCDQRSLTSCSPFSVDRARPRLTGHGVRRLWRLACLHRARPAQRSGFAAARGPDGTPAKASTVDKKPARDLRAQRGRQQPLLGRATHSAQRLQRPQPCPFGRRTPDKSTPPTNLCKTQSPLRPAPSPLHRRTTASFASSGRARPEQVPWRTPPQPARAVRPPSPSRLQAHAKRAHR